MNQLTRDARPARGRKAMVLLAVLAGLGVALVIQFATSKEPEVARGSFSQDAQPDILAGPDTQTLTAKLERQDQKIAELSNELALLREQLGPSLLAAAPQTDAATADTDELAEAEIASTFARSAPGDYTVEQLIAGGFTPERASSVLAIADRVSFERMETLYQARQDPERYRRGRIEFASVRDAITEAFDETTYDRYLYATGQSNRVNVSRVLQDSPASTAGLQTGDVIVSMAGQRVFTGRELREATRNGTSGELITVTVQRNRENFDVYVPRGPLGVMIKAGKQAPDADS